MYLIVFNKERDKELGNFYRPSNYMTKYHEGCKEDKEIVLNEIIICT